MPTYPNTTEEVAQSPAAVYSNVAHLAATAPRVFPLHIGDTYLEPPQACRMETFRIAEHPGMHRYAPVAGLPALRAAVAARVQRRSGTPTSPEEILITAGATGALGAVVGAIVSPGEEVLMLAPHWPLIAGIVRTFHGRPISVPCLDGAIDVESVLHAVAAHHTQRCIALYINTPNNPTGKVLPAELLQALVLWARQHNVWILADEVYEDYVYEGEHTYLRALAPERTIAVHSFSKAFGMAGNRAGFVAASQNVCTQALKVATHTYYSTPTASQLAALAALGGPGDIPENSPGDQWIAQVKPQYAAAGAAAAQRLGLAAPQGSTFLFVDVRHALNQHGLAGLLRDCANEGLLVAPGTAFGPYPHHLRVCFSAAPKHDIVEGVEILARRLGL